MKISANVGCAVHRVLGFGNATGGKKREGNFGLKSTSGLSVNYGIG